MAANARRITPFILACGSALVLAGATDLITAQSSPEAAIREVNDGILKAAAIGDKAAYMKLLADDLRWVDGNGALSSKAERVRDLVPVAARQSRIFRDVDIKMYGTTAVLMCKSDWTDTAGLKKSQVVHRVFVERGGQWQMVSHSTTPLPDRP